MLNNVLRKDNNYRYYTVEHIKQIIVAKEMKKMNLKIEETKDLFFHYNLSNLIFSIERQIEKIKDDFEQNLLKYELSMMYYAHLREAVAILRHFNARNSNNYNIAQFRTKSVVALEYHETFDDIEQNAIEQAAKIQVIADKINTAPLGGLIYLTYEHFNPETCSFDNKLHRMQVAIPVLDTRIPCKYYTTIKAFRGVSTYHFGEFHKTLKDTYIALMKWAKANKYKLSNRSVEEWLIGSTVTDNSKYWIMKIYIPFDE